MKKVFLLLLLGVILSSSTSKDSVERDKNRGIKTKGVFIQSFEGIKGPEFNDFIKGLDKYILKPAIKISFLHFILMI